MKQPPNKSELHKLYFDDRLPMWKIAKKMKYSVQTIHKYFHIYGFKAIIPDKAWNSGKTYKDDSRILVGKQHPRWKNKSNYLIDFKLKRKEIINGTSTCNQCDSIATVLHHKNKDTRDNSDKNLLPLCASHHTILHNKERGVTVYKHNCEWCKKEFTILHNRNCNQKFCSLSCKSKYHYHIDKKTLPQNKVKRKTYNVKCKLCKKLFTTFRKQQIFCSYSCSGKSRKHRRLPATPTH